MRRRITAPRFPDEKYSDMSEFEKYARGHRGISSLALHDFQSVQSAYVSPTIIEERQLNVATMDVFSRLMMDRIIFLGAPIYDDAANIIQAQLLFLESVDPTKDVQIYINSPGGSVTAGLGIYDTMQLVSCDVATICTGLPRRWGPCCLRRRRWQAFGAAALARDDTSAAGRCAGSGLGYRDHGTRNSQDQAQSCTRFWRTIRVPTLHV